METFEKLLGEDSPLLNSIKARGFETPSEIQEKSIPAILEGKDVIAGAATGSGKTLAFAAGLIHNIKKGDGIKGLVLTPTRELAEQVTRELTYFSKNHYLTITSVYGGVSMNNQIRNLSTTDIVVGTPGRILDHIKRRSIDFSGINTLVLDEADQMLDMGFIEDVEKIIQECSTRRQTLLFSATIFGYVEELATKYMKNPVEIHAEPKVDPKKLMHVYYDVDTKLKYSLLKHLLEQEKSKLVMIFCATRKNVDFVSKNLKFSGIDALPIHGGFSQEKRNRMLQTFHSKRSNILVATDVAARGLDIQGVSHVYNYDIPKTQKDYIHRIGRTARAGNEGKVINLLSSRDYENFKSIDNGEFDITRKEVPFIKLSRILWMPKRRSFGNRDSRPRRFGGRSRDDRPRSFGNRDSRPRRFGGENRFRRGFGRTNSQRSFGGENRHSSSGRNFSRRRPFRGRNNFRTHRR